MKRTATLLASLALALGLGIGMAPAAEADEWGPWNITDAADVCVRSDFTATGSGWNISKAVANWNSVQSSVRFRMGYTADCSDVLVHRYSADDGLCGRTDFVRLWDQARQENGVVYVAGADVYLNDACSPRKVMRKTFIAHELGHAIGLMHAAAGVDDSVMSPTYLATRYRGVPGRSDVAAVTALYAH